MVNEAVLKTVLGEYRLSNSSHVSVDISDPKDIFITENHENIHNLLSRTTTYGAFLMLMNISNQIDSQYEIVFQVLCKKMLKVQEATATYVEYMELWHEDGKAIYEKKLAELKMFNQQYYKHYKRFEFLDIINEPKFSSSIAIAIAKISLDIDITLISTEIIKNKTKLEKFFSSGDNSLKFSPDSRFEKISSYFKKIILEEITCEEFDKLLEKFDFENEAENYYDKLKQYFSNLYFSSIKADDINKRIDKLEPNTKYDFDFDDKKSLFIYPTQMEPALAIKSSKLVEYNEFINETEKKADYVYFMLYSRMFGENIMVMSLVLNFNKNKVIRQYASTFHNGKLNEILKNIDSPIILQGKNQEIIQFGKKVASLRKKVYLCMDQAIIGNLDFINKEFYEGYFTFIRYSEAFSVFVCEKNGIVIVQAVSKHAESKVVDNIFIDSTKKLELKLESIDDRYSYYFNYQDIEFVIKYLVTNEIIKNI